MVNKKRFIISTLVNRFTIMILALLTNQALWAGLITKNTDGKIIVEFSSEEKPEPQTTYTVLDQNSRDEIGLIIIGTIKNQRAVAQLLKGNAKPGDPIDLVQAKTKTDPNERIPADETKDNKKSRKRQPRTRFGLGLVYINTAASINKTNIGAGLAAGTTFGLNAAIDYRISSQWAVTSSLGLHPYKASVDDGGFTLTQTANAILLESTARYIPKIKLKGLWMGLGLGYVVVLDGTYTSNVMTAASELSDFTPKNSFALNLSTGYNMNVGRGVIGVRGSGFIFQPVTSNDQSIQTYQILISGVYYF